jgi:hypothetical protein
VISKRTREEVVDIGANSYALHNFNDLKKSASKAKQIEALRADRRWHVDHNSEIIHRINVLLYGLEYGPVKPYGKKKGGGE